MRSCRTAWLRRTVLGAAAGAGLLGAAGCSNAAPGVVAYVGDREISQQQVESAVAAVSSTVEAGQTVSTEAVVNAMIQGELAQQIAADKQIALIDNDRDALLKRSNLAPLLNVPAAKPIAYDVADQQLVAKKMGAKAFLAELEKRSVKLNPRYGVLDPKQKTVVADQSGSLSQPAAAPSP